MVDETEVSAAQRASLKPDRKMFVGVSPKSRIDKPESAAVQRQEEFRQPQVASEEANVSALGKADGVALREAVALEVQMKLVWRDDFLVAVSSEDAPNEPIDGDVGQDLDGHDPSLLSHVSPVDLRRRLKVGDVVEASLWDYGVSSNESCHERTS